MVDFCFFFNNIVPGIKELIYLILNKNQKNIWITFLFDIK